MAEIVNYVRPSRLYRYRPIDKLNRELEAIEEGYLFCAAYKDLNDPMEGFYAATRRLQGVNLFEEVRREILENKRRIGVCSFSEVHNHELMWAHYSSQFKGICIGYDLYKLLRRLQGEVTFSRVFYNEEVPNLRYSNKPYNYEEKARMVLSCKNHRWLYEREWRMFAPNQGRVRYSDVNCVTGIYVGARIAPTQLRKIEKRTQPLGIPIHKMDLDGYTMTFR